MLSKLVNELSFKVEEQGIRRSLNLEGVKGETNRETEVWHFMEAGFELIT